MSRPATKTDLLNAADEQFENMWKLIDAMAEDEKNTEFDFSGNPKLKEAHWTRDKNLRDVFIHLHEWHQLLLNWVETNMNGEVNPFIPAPYNWKTCGQMNTELWRKHQLTTYENSKKMLLVSHKKVMEMIESFSNEELFESKHFTWTGTNALGSYCVSATSSHYDWAVKKIKKHIKMYKDAHKN